MWQIFISFLLLGCLSFGGPAAHIGYFHRTFVKEKKWLSAEEYANLVALSQILPGPGSSQVCFAIGYQQGKLIGAFLAFSAFTLPSFLLMSVFAMSYAAFNQHPFITALISTLKIVAVVVVIDAVYGMFRQFCQTKMTRSICLCSAIFLLLFPSPVSQVIVLVFAAVIGGLLLTANKSTEAEVSLSFVGRNIWFWLFLVLLGASLLHYEQTVISLFSRYFQAGSLVFGGGHVVLPLLQSLTVDQVSNDAFMAGYAAAQGIPGPMFTFASFLGSVELTAEPFLGALIATVGIFMPGFLLMLAFLPHWHQLSAQRHIAGVILAVNAAVVGLLLNALYQPLFVSAVGSASDVAMICAGLLILKVFNWSVLRLLMIAVVSALLTTYM
ncbi:chromate efflux transporter [Thalassotalea sediminis]|uniref:chromate efflux transporter n=1 Tax=Thalassotalea sediminis TaxID=1759089 RepID=UPI0025729712|nr:chromate efflux transporter [Thalassotalea sediminis]